MLLGVVKKLQEENKIFFLETRKAESKERQRKRLTTMKTMDVLCAAILLIAGCMTTATDEVRRGQRLRRIRSN